MSRSITTLRVSLTCSSVTTLIPSIKTDGAKATIRLGKELALLSWQITLMSKTATSYSKLTRLVLREKKRDLMKRLTKDLKKKNL